MGASGQHRWQQRCYPGTSAAEQGLEAGSRRRSRRRGSQPRDDQPQRPGTARGHRPSVTTGRLLTRGRLRRVGQTRGSACERGPLASIPCGSGVARHALSDTRADSKTGGQGGRSRNGLNPRVGCRTNANGSRAACCFGTPAAGSLRGAQRSKPSKPGGTAGAEGAGEDGRSPDEGRHRRETRLAGTGRSAHVSTEGRSLKPQERKPDDRRRERAISPPRGVGPAA
jgi:hypothetical protein